MTKGRLKEMANPGNLISALLKSSKIKTHQTRLTKQSISSTRRKRESFSPTGSSATEPSAQLNSEASKTPSKKAIDISLAYLDIQANLVI